MKDEEIEKAAENWRNTYRPSLRKSELAGEWVSSSTYEHKESFIAGARWALGNLRIQTESAGDEVV